MNFGMDYIDLDVSYLLGLIIGRGTILKDVGGRKLIIEFPFSSLEAQGISSTFDLDTSIKLGLFDIRERLLELLDTDIQIVKKENGYNLVVIFLRNNIIWRDILLFTEGATSYPYFKVPSIFYDVELPIEWKREFVRGYADVAGNIRYSNRYLDGRNRVRLDVLNFPTNWNVPIQLCTLLQEHLEIPVQLIVWGHPNLNRDFREHQINIFAKDFLKIGFSFNHKQKILEEFVEWDNNHSPNIESDMCPGIRKIRRKKPSNDNENNESKLDKRLVGNHFDSYWQICKALGCTRYPPEGSQLTLDVIVDEN